MVSLTCVCQGSPPNLLWQTTSPHSLHDHLLWQQHLASEGDLVQQLHGGLRVSDLGTEGSMGRADNPRLNGLGAGPAETAQPTIIADVIFLHDRGKYQTLYFAFYFGSLMVCPSLRGDE